MAVLGEKAFNQHSMFGMTEEDWVSDGCGARIRDGEQMRTARKQSAGISSFSCYFPLTSLPSFSCFLFFSFLFLRSKFH